MKELHTCKRCEGFRMNGLMSIVLNVHPGGTIGHPGGQQKSFCRSVTEGTRLHLTVLAYRTSLFRIGPR